MLPLRVLVASCLVMVLPVALATVGTAQAQPPQPKDGPLGMKFVPLPKGTFYMGWNGQKGSAKKTEIKEDFEIAVHHVRHDQVQEREEGRVPVLHAQDRVERPADHLGAVDLVDPEALGAERDEAQSRRDRHARRDRPTALGSILHRIA